MNAVGTRETSNCLIRLRADGILEQEFKAGAVDTLETAQENGRAIDELIVGAGPVALLISLSGILSQTREARQFYRSESLRADEGHVCRVAVVVQSPVARVIASFFGALGRQSQRPTRLFTDPGNARAWLREGLA